jgi:hypothetical protein
LDWVQDTVTATTKWGAIGDWNVSSVKNMSSAFTRQHRSELVMSYSLVLPFDVVAINNIPEHVM